MIKPDWNKFKAKSSDNPEKNFEWFCYLLFCQEHHKLAGIFRYKNQAAIETNPITVGNEVIGWQAKFYGTTLSDHKDDIINILTTSKNNYPNLTKIIFYTNQEWAQGRNLNDPSAKTAAEAKANELRLDLEWRTASYFESPFVTIDNELIAEHFFNLDRSIGDVITEKQAHAETILFDIHTDINFGSQEIELDRSEVLNKIREELADVQIIILGGVAGVGKTAVIKKLHKQLKGQYPFYIFKSSEFNVANVDELFKPCTLQEFIEAHQGEQFKVIVIDSAEKLLDLANTDPFREFLSTLVQNDWKIIFTARSGYLLDLDNQFIDNYRITPTKFYVENLSQDDLDNLARTHNFRLPADERLLDLIKNPFYLNEYLRFYDVGEKIDYLSFKVKLWSKIILKSKPSREQCFLRIAIQRASEGQFFVIPKDDTKIVEELVQDGILGYEPPGYFITHDIYEEWALEKIIESEFTRRADHRSFLDRIGSSLPMRRAYRNWISENLLLNDPQIKTLVGDVVQDEQIESFWKDETIISVLLSEYSNVFLDSFETKLLENKQDLLKRVTFLLRIACKEVDTDFFRQLGIKKSIQLPSMRYVLTKPKGSGWKTLIEFVHKNLDKMGVENTYFILPVIHEWNSKYKNGATTRLCSLIALQYYQWSIKEEVYFSRDEDVKEQLFQTILYGASEIKVELATSFDEVRKNKWKRHREPYNELVEYILTKVGHNIELINTLPSYVIKLADLFWTRTERENDFYGHHSIGVEQYFSMEDEIVDYFPASAYQTPIYWLLKASLQETVDFILSFTNRATTSYAQSRLAEHEVEEVEVKLENGTTSKEYLSNRLWSTYRGTQVSTHILESMHMALEKYFLEEGKNAEASALESWLFYLLKNARSGSITGVVVSIVLAYPEKTFNVAAMLFQTKEFFLYDTSRLVLDQSAKLNYSIGYGLNYEHKIFQDERIATCDDKHRSMSLENLALKYQFFRDEGTSEDESKKRQERIWDILDEHYKRLPQQTKETPSDKTWRLYLARMDRRKMKPTTEEKDGGVLINFNPELEPELKDWSDKALKENAEHTRYLPLKLWAHYKYENDDRCKQYAQFEKDPHFAFEEAVQIARQSKDTDDSTFNLFNHSIPADVCSVLLRDYLDQLSKEEKIRCKDIVLSAASSSLRENYQYQIADGVGTAISVLPIVLLEFPDARDLEKQTLLLTLFDPHSIGMSGQFSDHSVSAIYSLWKTNFEDAQSLLIGYLLLKPKYEALREELRRTEYSQGRYSLHECGLVKTFIKRFKDELQKIVRNSVSLDDLKDIIDLDLGILETAFQLIPVDTTDKDHKLIAHSIIAAFAKHLLSNDREDRIDYAVKHGFLRRLAYLVLNSSKEDVADYLNPFVQNFNNSGSIAELFEEFILAEDKLSAYDNFWAVWHLFLQNVMQICKIGDEHWYADRIIRSYLFAQTQWKETATEWHTLRESNKNFFEEMVKHGGHRPCVLYSISKLLNDVGSIYLQDGITWISSMLSKNENLRTAKRDKNTIYYLENLVKKYVYKNQEKIRRMRKAKEEILVILNFLIEKGSVVGYLLRESIL